MKLSVSTYSLWRWRQENRKTTEQAMQWIADAGLKAVELSGLDEKAGDKPLRRAAQLRRHAGNLGLAVANYCTGAELLCPPAAQREAIDKLKRQVDIAAELGVGTMRHDVTRGFDGEHAKGIKGPKSFDHALRIVVPAIREVSDYAAIKGIKTSLENHGFYMQDSRRVKKLIDTVGHPNFRLTIDMGNFLCVNENPVSAVARLAKYAVMAHVKDFHVRDKKNVPPTGWFNTPTAIALRGAIVGHGAIDVPAELRLLKKSGYKGYLSLEFEGIEEPASAVKLGLDYLRREMASLGILD